MRIALAQVNLHVGNFTENTRQIIETIQQAQAVGAHLVVFSELSICGYPPRDLLLSDEFVRQCRDSVNKIAEHCTQIAAIVGGPDQNTSPDGKRLFNAAFFLENGKVSHVYHKGLLPDYDVFDEYRYFEPATTFKTIMFRGRRIALTICEDLWNLNQQPLYSFNPMDFLLKENPDLMISISASPFSWNRVQERMLTMSGNARKYNLPLFYLNQVGCHTELIFDGGSAVYNSQGMLVDCFEPFKADLRVYDLDEVNADPGKPLPALSDDEQRSKLIYQALVMGVRDYFVKSGIKKAILGLSGGLDSALVLVLACHALGKENVWAILMPGPYSSDHSVEDARQLAQNLDVKYDIISINTITDTLDQVLKPLFKGTSPDITEENLQARARAIVLMGLSNKFGHMLLNTSNKSEAAVGYGTLYGDMAGGLSVIGDVYKTQAYELANYINSLGDIIPENIISKPPSAELRPDQKDTDSLPEYSVLDEILYCYIEKQMSKKQIVDSGFEMNLVSRVINMVDKSEFKRLQSPPILRVSSKAFGPGRQMPIVAKYL